MLLSLEPYLRLVAWLALSVILALRWNRIRERGRILGMPGTAAAWIAAVAPVAVLVVLLARLSVDVPILDELWLVPTMGRAFDGTLTFADVWTYRANEHRIAAPLLVMIPLALATGWNIVAEQFASLLCAATTFAISNWAVRKTSPPLGARWLPTLPAFSIVVFSLAQAHNWMVGWQLTICLNVAAVVAGFALLSSDLRPWLRLVGGLAAGCTGTYALANGILFWPLGLWLVAVRRERGRWWRCGVWCAAAAACIADFVLHRTGADTGGFSPARIGRLLVFTLVYLGNPATRTPLSQIPQCGVSGELPIPSEPTGAAVVLGLFALAWRLRRVRPEAAATGNCFLALGLFAAGSAFVTAVGREQQFGIYGIAVSSRYVTIASCAWIALLGLLWANLAGPGPVGDAAGTRGTAGTSGRRTTFCLRAAFVFATALVLDQSMTRAGDMQAWSRRLTAARDSLLHEDSDTARILRAHRLSLFRNARDDD